ncbi:hypothetical protein DL96DRAFT_503169 [Flagelloscypha sp. PMI_526]|nr:hypothetical protein DL96DRAFT_503169 [Flagelloscypha sp. PMI_526]
MSGHSPLELLRAIMHRLQFDVMDNKDCHPWLLSLKKDPTNPIIRPHEVFDMIAGSGTGGLIAGLLGSMKLPVGAAMDEYLAVAQLLFPAKKSNNTKKLEAALKSLVLKYKGENAPLIDPQNRRAQASSNSFILAHVATNMRGTIPAKFRSYNANDVDMVNCELWEALRATTADLGLFDDFFIHGEKYWGTSMGNGNPTQYLCDEIKQLYPGKRADLILSLGCGHPDTVLFRP